MNEDNTSVGRLSDLTSLSVDSAGLIGIGHGAIETGP